MNFKTIKKGNGWYLMSEDSKVVMGKTLYRLVRMETGEEGGSILITTMKDLIGSVTLKDVTISGNGSSIDAHLLKDINLLRDVEIKSGCEINVMEGSVHIENRLFEGVGYSVNHKYEDSGNLIIMN